MTRSWRSWADQVKTTLIRLDPVEHFVLLHFLVKWTIIATVVGVLAGTASAVFLYGLAVVTAAREATWWLLLLLPVGGFPVGLAYHYLGGRSTQGNDAVFEEIHVLDPSERTTETPERPVPVRMAPLVLVGTWVTHLFGGSAGREGTAIQMTGGLSDGFARLVRLGPVDRRLVLIASVAGGFGSVFGVPLAGAIFALEVQAVGRARYDGLVPALVASVVGNLTMETIHLPHDVTPAVTLPAVGLESGLLARVAVAGLAFALASLLFSELTDAIKRLLRRTIRWSPARPVLGGTLVVALTLAIGTTDYLGLSLDLIGDSLEGREIVAWAFILKILFTSVTIGSGFQGGEVTPLFVIGATLGGALSDVLGVPQPLLSGIGLVAVFAAATNTPLACTVMGIELFGAAAAPYLLVGCVVAYVFASHRGIYGSQPVAVGKHGRPNKPHGTIEQLRQRRRRWLASPEDER